MNFEWYQTIPELGIKGRFNTPEEFDKIGLPKNLKDKSVLDIGCNIGAFLVESIRRGADLCDGVEPDLLWLLIASGIAKRLNLNIDFWKSIDELPADGRHWKWDIVLLLSVLHLVDEPQPLFDWAFAHTRELLIVEINDRLQTKSINLPKRIKKYGTNKDNRSIYHVSANHL